jgi:hypothetical protein
MNAKHEQLISYKQIMLNTMKLGIQETVSALIVGLFVVSLPMSVSASEVCNTHEQVVVSDTTNQIDGGGDAVAAHQSSLWTSISGAEWIWKTHLVESPVISETAVFSKTFDISGSPASSVLSIAGDDYFTVYVNGREVASEFGEGNFLVAHDYTLDPTLFHSGINEIKIEVINAKYFYDEGATAYNNPAGVTYALTVTSQMCIQNGNGGQGKLIVHTSGTSSSVVDSDNSIATQTGATVPEVSGLSKISTMRTGKVDNNKVDNNKDEQYAADETATSTSDDQEKNVLLATLSSDTFHSSWQNWAKYFLIVLIFTLFLLVIIQVLREKKDRVISQ